MTDDERDFGKDEELGRLLRQWGPPVVPRSLDERVLEAYRREFQGSWWRRLLGWSPSTETSSAWGVASVKGLLSMSVRVPLPVLLMVTMMFLITVAYAFRPAPSSPTAVAPQGTGATPLLAQASQPIVTSTSLAGFRPVSEVTATVVSETIP